MARSIVILCVAPIVTALTIVSGQGQPPSQPPVRDIASIVGTGVIRGRIVDVTGQPVRKVRVRATSSAMSGGRLAKTDLDGRYEINALRLGAYTLTAEKPGYLSSVYGRSQQMGFPVHIPVSDGRIIEHIDFKLERGAVVTGMVIDEFGEPVAEAQVSLVQYRFTHGFRRRTITNPRRTNDLGEFRIFGIPPGRYYLQAIYRTMAVGDPTDRAIYAPTYYPAAATAAGGELLTVAADQTLAGKDITLTPARSARVSGTVTDSSGKPLSNASVTIAGETVGLLAVPVQSDGSFSMAGLAPGDYVVRTTVARTDEMAAVALSLSGGDVSDVRLVPVSPARLVGRISIDPAAAAPPKPSDVRVSALVTPEDALLGGASQSATVNDDFTFEFKVRPGRPLIRSTVSTPDWTLKAVRVAGVDVTDEGVTITANQPPRAVEVELTNRQSELSGRVVADNNDAARNATVIIFARDRQKWTPFSRHVVVNRPDPTCRYRVRLDAGTYYAIALDSVEPDEWNDPDFLERIRLRATTISIGELDRTILDLRLLPGH